MKPDNRFMPIPALDDARIAKYMGQIDRTESGCWVWLGPQHLSEYGRISINQVSYLAHRVFYTHFVGPIEYGLTLDHVCRNRPCVNPAHLEPVTYAENNRRKAEAKQTCSRGHAYEEGSVVFYSGHRKCRACLAARNGRNNIRRQAIAAARAQ